MNACSQPLNRCLPSLALLSLFLLSPLREAAADDNPPYHPTLVSHCVLQLDPTEELCGWVDYATHDSIAYRPSTSREPVSSSDTSLDQSLAAAAALAFASAGLSVEQIVEPFAMVGPYLDNSLEAVRQYQSWWDTALANAKQLSRAEIQRADSEAETQKQLSRIAAEEPLDIEDYGPSVIVEEFSFIADPPSLIIEECHESAKEDLSVVPQTSGDQEPGIEIVPLDPMVGGSAIIFTIEESYMPYDVAVKDMRLWSVLPGSTRPFCIHSHGEDLDSMAMWREFDQHVVTQSAEPRAVQPDAALAYCGSADCLLDELIWKAENWIADRSESLSQVDARDIGRQLAVMTWRSNRLVSDAAEALASRWPKAEAPMKSSPAGEALLARAGAIATEAVIVEMPAVEIAASGDATRLE